MSIIIQNRALQHQVGGVLNKLGSVFSFPGVILCSFQREFCKYGEFHAGFSGILDVIFILSHVKNTMKLAIDNFCLNDIV